MPNVKQFIGLPLTITIDGRKAKVGEVVNAHISADRTSIVLDAKMTNEEMAGIIGAAADKSEAEESPIGMTDAEIEGIIRPAEVVNAPLNGGFVPGRGSSLRVEDIIGATSGRFSCGAPDPLGPLANGGL